MVKYWFVTAMRTIEFECKCQIVVWLDFLSSIFILEIILFPYINNFYIEVKPILMFYIHVETIFYNYTHSKFILISTINTT